MTRGVKLKHWLLRIQLVKTRSGSEHMCARVVLLWKGKGKKKTTMETLYLHRIKNRFWNFVSFFVPLHHFGCTWFCFSWLGSLMAKEHNLDNQRVEKQKREKRSLKVHQGVSIMKWCHFEKCCFSVFLRLKRAHHLIYTQPFWSCV